jgi:hypothetical protein
MSEAAAAIRAGAVQVSDPAQTALAIDYVERNLITLVREFPQTRFHLVFPPYSRAKFAIWHQYRQGDAAAHLAVIRYLAESSSRLPNLQVSGFEDQDFLDDIARYKDMDHFDPEINTLIAHSIGQGAHRITPMNVEHYIAEATRRAREYPLDEMAARLGACIEPPAGVAP